MDTVSLNTTRSCRKRYAWLTVHSGLEYLPEYIEIQSLRFTGLNGAELSERSDTYSCTIRAKWSN